jgi:hypothetical protein
MTTYTIIPAGDGSDFHIGVVGNDGARHTMLGFETLAEAEAWIIEDKRLNYGAETFHGQETPA